MLDEVNQKIVLRDGFCVFDVRASDALRHGRASSIIIEIDTNLDDSFSITIIDDGMGPQGSNSGLK